MHPDDLEVMWRKGLAQLKVGEIMDVDFRLKTRPRGYRWFNSRAKAHYGPDGRIVRMAGAITDIHEQRLATETLRVAQSELTRLAYRDTLTDQYNRRYFDEHFQREWDRSRRTHDPLALLIVDLDHFKAYNDQYGHPLGDRCLVQVAQLLARASSRSADIVARLGGEEFGIVLPGTSAAGAEEVAHRIRSQLKEAAIPHVGAPGGVVTLSIGISATSDREGPSTAEMFDQADKALYEVKRRGRDGAMVYSEALRSGTFTAAGAPAP
jgi:diguanylate cyclase (GGDEF)-like protein